MGQPLAAYIGFHPTQVTTVEAVYYFSAYADWLPDAKARHLRYVKALSMADVKPVMGKFKSKDRKCPKCRYQWKGHEEKETDVNIALAVVMLSLSRQI